MTNRKNISVLIGAVSSVGVYSAIADIAMATGIAFIGGMAGYVGNYFAKKIVISIRKRKNKNANKN